MASFALSLSSLIGHHRPVVYGCIRVGVFCDVPESLSVILPLIRKSPVFHRTPVGSIEKLISLSSHFFPCDIMHALLYDVGSIVDGIGAVHHFTPILMGLADAGENVVISVILALPPALALNIVVGIATEPYS